MRKSRYSFDKFSREKARKKKHEEKVARRSEKKLKENAADNGANAQVLSDEYQDS